jgi:hypothetical protein
MLIRSWRRRVKYDLFFFIFFFLVCFISRFGKVSSSRNSLVIMLTHGISLTTFPTLRGVGVAIHSHADIVVLERVFGRGRVRERKKERKTTTVFEIFPSFFRCWISPSQNRGMI